MSRPTLQMFRLAWIYTACSGNFNMTFWTQRYKWLVTLLPTCFQKTKLAYRIYILTRCLYHVTICDQSGAENQYKKNVQVYFPPLLFVNISLFLVSNTYWMFKRKKLFFLQKVKPCVCTIWYLHYLTLQKKRKLQGDIICIGSH
jgi:hypothetical protein